MILIVIELIPNLLIIDLNSNQYYKINLLYLMLRHIILLFLMKIFMMDFISFILNMLIDYYLFPKSIQELS